MRPPRRQPGPVVCDATRMENRQRIKRARELLREVHGLVRTPAQDGAVALAGLHIAEAHDALGRELAGFGPDSEITDEGSLAPAPEAVH